MLLVNKWTIPLLCCASLSAALLLGCNNEAEEPVAGDASVQSPLKQSCKVDRADAPEVGSTKSAVAQGTLSPDSLFGLTPGQQKAAGAILTKFGSNYYQGCSGTLVADDVVLTAAHCAVFVDKWDGDPSTVSKVLVPASMTKFGIGEDIREPEARLDVREVHVHPGAQMNFTRMENDLAVMILDKPASSVIADIEPIPINSQPIAKSSLGQPVVFGGYGSLTCRTYDFSPVRYWARLSLAHLFSYDLGAVSDGAGHPTKGDSGGGLAMRFSDDQLRLVSLLSMGGDLECHTHAGPRLDAHYEWLSQFLPKPTPPPAPCGEVDAAGTCKDGVATYCDQDEIVEQDCAKLNKVCGKDNCGLSRCIDKPGATDPRCDELDYFGRCAEGVAQWCVDGQYRSRDCASLGEICGESTDPWVGHTCLSGSVSPDARAPDARPPDAGVPDAGKDAPAPPTGTCAEFDKCVAACGSDFFCEYPCYEKATPEAKQLWGTMANCQYCCARKDPDNCDQSEPHFAKCSEKCAAGATPECVECVLAGCKAQGDACDQHVTLP